MLRENEGWDKEGRSPIAHRRGVVTGGKGFGGVSWSFLGLLMGVKKS